MKFNYYRLFVENTDQISILSDLKKTKTEILEMAFDHDEPIYVNNGKQVFVFKKIVRQGNLLWAKIAKRSTVQIEHPAEEDFVMSRAETWPGVHILINLSDDPLTGQAVAVELDKSVFADTQMQLDKLLLTINKIRLKDHSFEIHINPITANRDFWKVVGDHAGTIKSLTLHVSAPNLFGAKNEFNKDLRLAQSKYGITEAGFSLENSEGNLRLPENDSFLNESVNYVNAGGGRFKITLRGRRGNSISSEDTVATKEINKDIGIEAAFENQQSAANFTKELFEWLKYEN